MALSHVRNVLGLLSAVNTTTTMTMAMARPPTRTPRSRARPDQPLPATVAGAVGAGDAVMPGQLLDA